MAKLRKLFEKSGLDPRHLVGSKDDDEHIFGVHKDWLRYERRPFSDIMIAWTQSYKLDDFLEETSLKQVGITENQLMQFLGGQLVPSLELIRYFSALIPNSFCSQKAFLSHAYRAHCLSHPKSEVSFGKTELDIVRHARLQKILQTKSNTLSTEGRQLKDFLESCILKTANIVAPEQEIDMHASLKGIAAAIKIDYRELIGEAAPPENMRKGYIEQLGTLLGLDERSHNNFQLLAEKCWDKQSSLAISSVPHPFPVLPEMLRFLRQSQGLSQVELAEKLGVERVTISNWETGLRTPFNRINDLAHALSISKENQLLLEQALPNSRIHSSKTKPFCELFSELVAHYDTHENFLQETGLNSHLTLFQVKELIEGKPPGKNLTDYLSYFVQSHNFARVADWRLSAENIRLSSEKSSVELSNNAHKLVCDGIINYFAQIKFVSEGVPPLSRMLRFLRYNAGESYESLSKKLGVTGQLIRNWEEGKGIPSEQNLAKYANIFSLSPENQKLIAEAIPVAKAHVSKTKSFHELFTQLLEKYGSDKKFLEKTGLEKHLTLEQITQLKNGTPPGENLTNCLSFFVTAQIVQTKDWALSAYNARILSSDSPIELAGSNYEKACNAVLKCLVKTAYPKEEIQALPRMLRFIRQSKGMSRKDIQELNIPRWEEGKNPPSEEKLADFAKQFSLSEETTALLMSALPHSRTLSKKAKGFSEMFSELLKAYDSTQDFLQKTGLHSHFTPEEIEQIGKTVSPDKHLTNYLSYFVPTEIAQLKYWKLAADSAVKHSSVLSIDFKEGAFSTAQNNMVQQIMSEAVNNLEALSSVLRFLRQSRGMSLGETAKVLGTNQKTLAHWENNRVILNFANLEKYANFFELTLEARELLLDLHPDKQNTPHSLVSPSPSEKKIMGSHTASYLKSGELSLPIITDRQSRSPIDFALNHKSTSHTFNRK